MLWPSSDGGVGAPKTTKLNCRYHIMTAKFSYQSVKIQSLILFPFIDSFILLSVLEFRFMEPGCAHHTMASNDATEFCHEIETNAMGESTIVAPKTKANKKEANCLDATGIGETTNITSIDKAIIDGISGNQQFNFPVDQTKANWGKPTTHSTDKTVRAHFTIFSFPFIKRTDFSICSFCFSHRNWIAKSNKKKNRAVLFFLLHNSIHSKWTYISSRNIW